ncbi:MAG TPA: MFS transporter [Steroidobacteraceae bacterium]|nr:MFS transporter [Steroidobacteraceae bacterium]
MNAAAPGAVAQSLYRRELAPWALSGIALGLVEGAAAAVLVKRQFSGLASTEAVNLAVAFVSGSPALSNMTSFIWANLAHGRERIRVLAALLAVFGLLVGLIGLLPRAGFTLAATVLSVIAARVVWAGILTVRAAVWSANYPRATLARIAGGIVTLTSLGMAVSAALAGIVLQTRPELARALYGVAGVAGLIAAWLYRRMRVRQWYRLRRAEHAENGGSEVFSFRVMRQILREDPSYRRFMGCMALYGAGNLMIIGQLVVLFSDRLHLSAALQIGLLTIVPLLCVPLFTPLWARVFDAGHVIEFRARQCWVVISAMVVVITAVFTGWTLLLWPAAVLFGIATAGANLGWNLGHNDFASLGKVQQYMGVNVTLTGMRGLVAPPLGVLVYTALERCAEGAGRFALALPVAITFSGAIGFNRMKHSTRGTRPQ